MIQTLVNSALFNGFMLNTERMQRKQQTQTSTIAKFIHTPVPDLYLYILTSYKNFIHGELILTIKHIDQLNTLPRGTAISFQNSNLTIVL